MGGRNFDRKLTAIGKAIPGIDIAPLCADLVRRIKHIRLKTQAGAYLLADSDGFVYVMREQSKLACTVTTKMRRLVVGLYASNVPVFPSSAQVGSDLIQHFIDIGYITMPPLKATSLANPVNSCITATQARSNP